MPNGITMSRVRQKDYTFLVFISGIENCKKFSMLVFTIQYSKIHEKSIVKFLIRLCCGKKSGNFLFR
jgi:hypothetical protein